MCRAFNEIKRDCIKKGYKEGYKEGLREAKELVTVEAEIAKKMLKEGMSIDLISRCTGLSKEEIEKSM